MGHGENHVEEFAKYCRAGIGFEFVLGRDSGASAVRQFERLRSQIQLLAFAVRLSREAMGVFVSQTCHLIPTTWW